METTAESHEPSEPDKGTPDKGTPDKGTPDKDVGVWARLWQSERGKEIAARSWSSNPSYAELQRRARLSQSVANRLAESPEPDDMGPTLPIACELYRQAIHWSLAAHAALATPQSSTPDKHELPSLADLCDSQVDILTELLPDEAKRKAVVAKLVGSGFADCWTAQQQLASDVDSYRRIARTLIDRADPAESELAQVWLARFIRLGLPLLTALACLLVIVVAIVAGGPKQEQPIPWKASSTYPEPGCVSPSQDCINTNFFFCTNLEQNPSIVFDLGEITPVSTVEVTNRTDCPECSARAIPLLVELSSDQKNWREVARRTTDFDEWTAEFEADSARWVRLRVPRQTFLHLKRVRIPR